MTTQTLIRWPLGLLGMLILVAGFELGTVRKQGRYTGRSVEEWGYPSRSLGRASRCDVLAFGDSLVKFGVLPRVLERRLGVSAFNLAMSGGRTPGASILFRRVVESGHTPKAVIIDGEALGLDCPPVARYFAELATLPECVDLGLTARDGTFLGELVALKLLPSYRARFEIRGWLMHVLTNGPADSFPPTLLPLFARNWEKNLGAEAMDRFKEEPGKHLRAESLAREHEILGPWVPDPLNWAYATRLLDLARDRGIPVFWLLPPYLPEVQAIRMRDGWFTNYPAVLKGLVSRYPNLTVIDGHETRYGRELVADMVHLNGDGAVVFTDAIAATIRRHLASPESAPRWVTLPPSDPSVVARLTREFDPDVESLTESADAFRAWGERVARGEVSELRIIR